MSCVVHLDQHATAEQIRRAAAAREMNHSIRVDRGLDARRIECLVGLGDVAAGDRGEDRGAQSHDLVEIRRAQWPGEGRRWNAGGVRPRARRRRQPPLRRGESAGTLTCQVPVSKGLWRPVPARRSWPPSGCASRRSAAGSCAWTPSSGVVPTGPSRLTAAPSRPAGRRSRPTAAEPGCRPGWTLARGWTVPPAPPAAPCSVPAPGRPAGRTLSSRPAGRPATTVAAGSPERLSRRRRGLVRA